MAAESGQLECIAKLLVLKADPNFNDAVSVLKHDSILALL